MERLLDAGWRRRSAYPRALFRRLPDPAGEERRVADRVGATGACNDELVYPLGALSDRLDRKLMLGAGLATRIAADIVPAAAPNLWIVMSGVAVWVCTWE